MMKLLMRSLAALFLLAAPAVAQTTANGPWQAALGSPNDAGCTYTSGKASIPCLLGVMVRQAAPSGPVGGTPATGSQFPWVQQAPGAIFNVAGTLTTKAGVSLASPAYRIPATVAGSNAQVFATGAKQMLHAYFCNKATTDRAVKFFDKATNPIPGTDAIVTSILAPAGTCAAIDFSGGGFPFVNGLAVAVTGAGGDSDTGSSVAAGDVVGLNIQHN